MIKSITHALHKSTFKNLSRYSPHLIKNSFSQSQSFESLKSSDFAKELGLEQEFKQVIKIQKKNESKKLQLSTLIFLFAFLAGGTVFIVSVIDSNEWKGFKYRVKNNLGRPGKVQKNGQTSQTEEYEKNLREIFDKKFKDRSTVDARFLRYVEDCINQKINKSKSFQTNKGLQKINLNQDVTYIIQNLAQKFINNSDQKVLSCKHQLLPIFQKIVYHRYKNSRLNTDQQISSKSLLNEPELKLILKLSKFLLIQGSLNQQILALKFYQSQKVSSIQNKTINSYLQSLEHLSQPQIEAIRQRITKNRQLYQKSMLMPNPKSVNEEKQPASGRETKIIKVKEQIIYSIEQVKKVNEIQKTKLKFLQYTFDQMLETQRQKNKNNNKK